MSTGNMSAGNIVVHGNGLTALVTAAALANSGRAVTLACGSDELAAAIRQGRLPFSEPGLAEALAAATAGKHLQVAATATAGPLHFLALQAEERALADDLIDALADAARGELVLVNQVNFGVGVTEQFAARLQARRGDKSARTAAVCFPDFLRRGTALANFRRPDRVILGADDAWVQQLLRDLLSPFIDSHAPHPVPVLLMPARAAEFTKQAVNGMLATRLSYMNDMANVADVLGIDIDQVRLGVGSDERIGSHHLYPGCGFGGTGFYQDLLSLKTTLDDSGVASRLVDTALAVNEEQKELLFRVLWQHYRGELAGRAVAIWGVAFKADTDRVDHAPSLSIIAALLAQGVTVRAHDPKALQQLQQQLGAQPGLILADDMWQAVAGADALLVLTEWQLYRQPDLVRLKQSMRSPVLLDGRNLYDPATLRSHGFSYYGIGRR